MWSRKFECCIICKTTKVKHEARGYCYYCYNKLPRKRKYNAEQKKRRAESSMRSYKKKMMTEEGRKQLREKGRRQAERIRNDERQNKLRTLSNKRYEEKKKFKMFLEGRGTLKKGITIVCYGCRKNCKVVSPIKNISNELARMKRFREVLVKNCKKDKIFL